METVDVRGVRVPALGLGTWELSGDACREAVEDALAIGYRHLDTAEAYDNEAQVGAAIAASGVPREEIWLTTKVWRDHVAKGKLEAAVEASLERLGTDHVDLLLIHWPVEEVPLEEQMAALGRVVERGRARHVGVSNFPTAWVDRAFAADGPAPLTNQVEYHPLLGQEAVLGQAREREMFLTAYSPLGSGAVLEDETLIRIGRAHDKSAAQVALRWLLDQPGVAAIPRSASAEHRRANFDVFDFALTDEERAAIDALPKDRRQIDPEFAPWWD